MRGLNKVMLIGRLGKDPEMVHFESGVAKASLTLATNEIYKNKQGEKVENTDWHNLVMWRGLAEVANKYLKKGSRIYVEGKLKTRSWDDKEGNKKYITEVEVSDMHMLDSKPDDNSGYSNNAETKQPTAVVNESNTTTVSDENDLPF